MEPTVLLQALPVLSTLPTASPALCQLLPASLRHLRPPPLSPSPSPGPTLPASAPTRHAKHALSAAFLSNRLLSTSSTASFSFSSASQSSSGASSDSGSKPSSGSEPPHALLASKCRVLPFSLDRGEAEREWERHHAGLFTAHPGGWSSAKAVLLPFWCLSAEAHVHVQSAQIGYTTMTTRYNPVTRRVEPHIDTAWRTVHPDWRYARRWAAEAPEMQVYGGNKYRHDPALDEMKPGEHVRQALTYSDYVRRTTGRTYGGGGGEAATPDRMIPFRLGPTEAAEMVRKQIRSAELRVAEELLLQQYGGQRVQLVVMDAVLGGLAATPVFSPAFVFKTRIRGTPLRTYVAGYRSGLSSGPRLPNPTRVATVAAVATPVALSVTGALAGASLGSALLMGVALPFAVGYGVASFWPELHAGFLRARASFQRPLPEVGEAEREQWWRYEWVRQDPDEGGYSYSEDARYSHSYSRREQAGSGSGGGGGGYTGGYYDRTAGAGAGPRPSSSSSSGGPRDPRGYYRTLGVAPGSSTEEVQAAFRAAALKWHPDRQPDPALKAESTRRFQAAQEAYSVLRDPARRAAYDRA